MIQTPRESISKSQILNFAPDMWSPRCSPQEARAPSTFPSTRDQCKTRSINAMYSNHFLQLPSQECLSRTVDIGLLRVKRYAKAAL